MRRWLILFTWLVGGSVTSVAATVLLFAPSCAWSQIPREAQQYRRDLARNARMIWGLDAPLATFAAQIHQESGWRRDARSPYAFGLAQFTPDTAAWIGGLDAGLASGDPGNPVWALRALVRYDRWLWDRSPSGKTTSPCDRMAFALAGYNGGAGWIDRDRRKARAGRADPDRWWEAVERYNAGRSAANFNENRDYPRRILRRHEPMYVRAGWGMGACA